MLLIGLVICTGLAAISSITFSDFPASAIIGVVAASVLAIMLGRKVFYGKDASRIEWLALLGLFTINSFTLSNDLQMFSPAATWVYGALGAFFVLRIVYEFRLNPPLWLTLPVYFFSGAAGFLSLYYSFYMLPLAGAGLIGILVLGLGLHAFMPACVFGTIVYYFFRDRHTLWEKAAFWTGAALPVILIISVAIYWGQINRQVRQVVNKQADQEGMPAWLAVSQRISNDYLTREFVLGDFKYDFTDPGKRMFGFRNMGMTFDRSRVHDPLLNTAQLVSGPFGLDSEARLKVLKTGLNSRHLTERKLWTGRDLSVDRVDSKVTIYPEFRLAYTEKIFWVKNNSWELDDTQEALFTFHLPEGSTSSSMSLWVNGEERPARLTTREKADRAYTQIVGVEVRDPALLHWQEGNRLTLTVFPCTPAEMRQVKIGFTIPLEVEDGQLRYRSVHFEGPVLTGRERIDVKIAGNKLLRGKPRWLKFKDDGSFGYTGPVQQAWEIEVEALPLSLENFGFNGACYHLEEASQELIPFEPRNIYLDLNAEWTREEFDSLWARFEGKNIFVYDGHLHRLKEADRQLYFRRMQQQRFSVFPIGQIGDPEQSLLITKAGTGTPHYSQLEELSAHFKAAEEDGYRLRVFSLNKTVPIYLRHFMYSGHCLVAGADPDQIDYYLRNRGFPEFVFRPGTVVVEESKVRIVKQISNCPAGNAPDHLLRLFAFNKILEQYNSLKDQTEQTLIGLANEAFVVSPVSSLIVLETREDYERFDIDVNERSLQNAADKGTGSVPEPHEWAIILLTAVFILGTCKYGGKCW